MGWSQIKSFYHSDLCSYGLRGNLSESAKESGPSFCGANVAGMEPMR
jgi:hypothetical protein